MEDRVADILAQRAALDGNAAGGVVLSVLLHGGITALAVYAALHQKPPELVNRLTIHMAPVAAVQAAPPPPAKIEAPKLQEPQPVIEQPKAAEPPKPVEKTVPISPFGKSAKKGSDAPPPPAPAPAAVQAPPGVATSTAEVPVGGSGVTALEGGDFPYSQYIERMKQLIGQHWFRPQTRAGATTTVYFVINRDGSIRDAEVRLPSGNGPFDRAALRAVLETSPLPALPFAYNGTYLGVHLTFK